MNPAYRFPKHPGPPGAPASPADLAVIQGMLVKSCITRPSDQTRIAVASTSIGGIAWAGEEQIVRVQVSMDGGRRWGDAELSPQNVPFAWRLWSINWTPTQPGYYTIMSRATDSAGNIQPIVATWNPSGYLYNAIDQIGVIVESGS